MEIVLSGANKASAEAVVCAQDLHTGATLNTYKQTYCAVNCFTCLKDCFLAAQEDRAVINIHRWNKETIDQKLIVPEKLSSLSSSHDLKWLVGGTTGGRIYLWELASGNLCFSEVVHYSAITVCAWTGDDKVFLTGSNDTVIKAWRLTDVFSSEDAASTKNCWKELRGHTQGIKQLSISLGPACSARVFSIALDRSLRIHDLGTGEAIAIIMLQAPIHSMTLDLSERTIYLGLQDGSIVESKLYDNGDRVQAIGGFGSMTSASSAKDDVFSGNSTAVTALAVSLDGSMLISGAQDGRVLVWDISTKQLVRTLKQHASSITHLSTQVRPLQHATQKNQHHPLSGLKRIISERDLDEHHIDIALASNPIAQRYSPITDLAAAQLDLQNLLKASQTSKMDAELGSLQTDLNNMTSAYNDLKRKHDHLQKEMIKTQL